MQSDSILPPAEDYWNVLRVSKTITSHSALSAPLQNLFFSFSNISNLLLKRHLQFFDKFNSGYSEMVFESEHNHS